MHPILEDRQRLQLHLIAWVLVGATLALFVRTLAGVGWAPALLFSVPLGLVAAPASLSAWYLCRAMPLARASGVQAAVAGLAASVVAASIWAAGGTAWWGWLARAGVRLPAVPPALLPGLLVGVGALAYLLALTVQYLLQAVEESSDAARRALESQVGQREAELRALRAQVDPHFLFNSLNSVSGLIAADPARARQMCAMLGDFLRESLSLGGTTRIPLEREVALAEQYLRVEQVRFGARLAVRVDLPPECRQVPVPSLLLQPLVENAVRHGIATCLDGGAIDLTAERRGGHVVMTVTNPRDPDEGRRGTGFGLDIVRRRLAAAFADRASLVVEATPDRYRVSVSVPDEEQPA